MSGDSFVLFHHYLHNILRCHILHFRQILLQSFPLLCTQHTRHASCAFSHFDSTASRVIHILYGGTAFSFFNVSNFLLDRVLSGMRLLGIDWNVQGHLKKNSVALVRELYRQNGRRRSAKLVPTFADRGMSRGQRNGSPRPLISVFWTGAATFFVQVSPQLTSRG